MRFLLETLLTASLVSSVVGSNYDFPGSVPSCFVYEDGMRTMSMFKNDKYGYCYYGIQLYSISFSKNQHVNSRLFLVRTIVDFTPGYAAYQNDETEFSSKSYLKSGYLHLSFFEYEDEDRLARSSSFYLKDYIPRSSTATKTITSSIGQEYSFSSGLETGVNLDGDITLKGNRTAGLSVSFGSSYSYATDEPTLSAQVSPSNENQVQWSFDYTKLDKITYTLNTYTILEVLDDGRGYEDYAFGIKMDFKMVNVEKGIFSKKEHAKTFTSYFRFRNQMIY